MKCESINTQCEVAKGGKSGNCYEMSKLSIYLAHKPAASSNRESIIYKILLSLSTSELKRVAN